jgi:hypothetical protein
MAYPALAATLPSEAEAGLAKERGSVAVDVRAQPEDTSSSSMQST